MCYNGIALNQSIHTSFLESPIPLGDFLDFCIEMAYTYCMEYKMLLMTDVNNFEVAMQKFLSEGWSPLGELQILRDVAEKNGERTLAYVRELIRKKQDTPKETTAEKFAKSYAKLSKRTKDLLEINQIEFGFDSDSIVLCHDGKTEKFSPYRALMALKSAKHCPANLNQDEIMDDLERCFL